MAIFPRAILPDLEKELLKKEVTVLTGMRQVGKTTLLSYLFEKVQSNNKVLLDLENPLHRRVFEEENYDNVWNNLKNFGVNSQAPAFIFLDEIQNLPIISRVVKYLYDHWETKFVLTGSSSYYLKNLFLESLAGRKIIYELFPLAFSEFLIFRGIKYYPSSVFYEKAIRKNEIAYHKLEKFYAEYMEYGGFPAVVLEENSARKRKILENVFTSYFETDVKSLADFEQLSKLRDLILILIARIGSKLDITKISSELGVARETIYAYLEFLERTYFINLVPKFTNNIDRQAAGSKKLYLCDSGLANVLGRLSEGQLFEQSVFQNLKPHNQIRYYEMKGREIDFIIDSKIALETKVSATKRDITTLRTRTQRIGLSEQYIVSLRYTNTKHSVLGIDL